MRLFRTEDEHLYHWNAVKQCQGPLWNIQAKTKIPKDEEWIYWIDVETNHSCAYVNLDWESVAIAVKIFRIIEHSPGVLMAESVNIVYIDIRQVQGIWCGMKQFFERLKDLAVRAVSPKKFGNCNPLLIEDDGGYASRWSFGSQYIVNALHLSLELVASLETSCRKRRVLGIPEDPPSIEYKQMENFTPSTHHQYSGQSSDGNMEYNAILDELRSVSDKIVQHRTDNPELQVPKSLFIHRR